MKRDLAIYVAVLLMATVIKYVIEIQWGSHLALGTRTLLPWIIDLTVYGTLGALAWTILRSRAIGVRLVLLALVAALPHLAFEVTHGSDPAYPYIGLLFIVPKLVWVAIGAGSATLFISKVRASETSS